MLENQSHTTDRSCEPSPTELPLLSEQFGESIRQGVHKALEEHATAGREVVISRNGEIVWVPAEQLLHGQDARADH